MWRVRNHCWAGLGYEWRPKLSQRPFRPHAITSRTSAERDDTHVNHLPFSLPRSENVVSNFICGRTLSWFCLVLDPRWILVDSWHDARWVQESKTQWSSTSPHPKHDVLGRWDSKHCECIRVTQPPSLYPVRRMLRVT